MRLAVYGAVLVIALGGVLLGLDWLSAPMSPMVNTEAGLRAVAPPPPPAVAPPVAAAPAPASPKATIGAPIVSPNLVPKGSGAPVPSGAEARTAPSEPIAAPEPEVRCNVSACTAAYRSFRASDCTYMPSAGERKLCAK
jgi:BA14K-like protein